MTAARGFAQPVRHPPTQLDEGTQLIRVMVPRFGDLGVLGHILRPIAGNRREAAAASGGNELDEQAPFDSLRINRSVDAWINDPTSSDYRKMTRRS